MMMKISSINVYKHTHTQPRVPLEHIRTRSSPSATKTTIVCMSVCLSVCVCLFVRVRVKTEKEGPFGGGSAFERIAIRTPQCTMMFHK